MLKQYFDKTLEFSKKIYYNNSYTNASMAQLVEQRIRNAQVVGSSPTTSSRNKPSKLEGLLGLFLYLLIKVISFLSFSEFFYHQYDCGQNIYCREAYEDFT